MSTLGRRCKTEEFVRRLVYRYMKVRVRQIYGDRVVPYLHRFLDRASCFHSELGSFDMSVQGTEIYDWSPTTIGFGYYKQMGVVAWGALIAYYLCGLFHQ